MTDFGDGALLTLDQFKSYAEVEHTEDDGLIGDLIAEAEARLQGYVEVPIAAATYTEHLDGGLSTLTLRRFPIDASSVTITDTQGTSGDLTDDETVAATEYRVYAERGQITKTTSAGQRTSWAHGRQRWKVVYDAGLDQHPLWSSVVKLELRASIRDLVSEWYDIRTPGLSSEKDGMSVERRMDADSMEIPRRVRTVWDQYRAVAFA